MIRLLSYCLVLLWCCFALRVVSGQTEETVINNNTTLATASKPTTTTTDSTNSTTNGTNTTDNATTTTTATPDNVATIDNTHTTKSNTTGNNSTARNVTLVSRTFSMDYFLFINGDTKADAGLETLRTALLQDLQTFASEREENITIVTVETTNKGACTAEDFTLTNFSACTSASSAITAQVPNYIHANVLADVFLDRAQYFVEEEFSKTHTDMRVLYDYPRWVKAAFFWRCTGVNMSMTVDEVALFVKTFEKGFKPIMAQDQYELAETDFILQNVQRNFEGNENENNNDVELFLRAKCSGDACVDENFANYLLLQSLPAFGPTFLGMLRNLKPTGAYNYFNDVHDVKVLPVENNIAWVPSPAEYDKTVAAVSKQKAPKWVWLIVLVVMGILIAAVVTTCMYAVGHRVAKITRRKDSDEVADVENANSKRFGGGGSGSGSPKDSRSSSFGNSPMGSHESPSVVVSGRPS